MAKSQQTDRTLAPDLLAQLELVFGWTERQALDALGTYMMSTDAGRALSGEWASRDQGERAA
jgi:hypothetical protein